jgi:hypothetical protein
MGQLTSPNATALLVCALALSVSCSSNSGAGATKTGQADAGDAGVPQDDAGADARTGAEAGDSCSQGCPGSAPAGSICAVSADAQLVDTAGAPVAGQVLLLCGLNLCSLPVKTNAQGKAHFNLCLNMTSPALKYLGDASYVSFGVAMTQPTQTFPPITLVPLPAQGMAFPSGAGTVTSGAASLQVGASVKFDPTQPNDPNSLEFRAAAVTPAQAPPGLDAPLGIKALWGLAPLNAALDPPGVLTIPNPDPTGWTAGTKVDFVMNGLDESPSPPVPYGGWGPVGTGTVSQDGQTITTDSGSGNGLPVLGLVGVGPHT